MARAGSKASTVVCERAGGGEDEDSEVEAEAGLLTSRTRRSQGPTHDHRGIAGTSSSSQLAWVRRSDPCSGCESLAQELEHTVDREAGGFAFAVDEADREHTVRGLQGVIGGLSR